MRAGRIFAVAVVLTVTSGTVHADPAADARARVTEGEALAKQGRFSEAIEKFRAAEQILPAAQNDCYIALAYRRLEQWTLARLHLDRCEARASASDPAPTWRQTVRTDVDAGIQRAGLVPVVFVIEPPEARGTARIQIRQLAEPFGPGTIHLAPAKYDVTVEAEGFTTATHELTVSAGKASSVTLVLKTVETTATPAAPAEPAPAAPAAPTTVQVDATPAPPPSRGPWPWITTSIAGAAAITGLVFHVQALGTKDDAESDAARYDDLLDRFERQRALAIGFYAAAAAAGGVTAYLWLRSPAEAPVSVGIVPVDGGAVVGIGWER